MKDPLPAKVDIVDFGEAVKSKILYSLYRNFWIRIALRYPPIISAFFGTADNPILTRSIDAFFGVVLIPRLKRYLEREKPDIVMSTYFTPHHYLERLAHWKKKRFLSIGINPEPFQSHSIWVAGKLDYSIVFSKKARDEMIEKGADPKKVLIFNYPIRPEFSEKSCFKEEARRKLGLSDNMLTCLLNFGAEGVGPVKKYMKDIVDRNLPLQVLIICGRNTKLKGELERWADKFSGKTRFVIRGFVDNMEDYICASDFVIGKAGPNSIMESIVVGRPPLIVSFMENERSTKEWVVKHQYGWVKRTVGGFTRFIERSIDDRSEIERYTENLRKLGYRSGSEDIVKFLLSLCRNINIQRNIQRNKRKRVRRHE